MTSQGDVSETTKSRLVLETNNPKCGDIFASNSASVRFVALSDDIAVLEWCFSVSGHRKPASLCSFAVDSVTSVWIVVVGRAENLAQSRTAWALAVFFLYFWSPCRKRTLFLIEICSSPGFRLTLRVLLFTWPRPPSPFVIRACHGSDLERTTIPENTSFEWNGIFSQRVKGYWNGNYWPYVFFRTGDWRKVYCSASPCVFEADCGRKDDSSDVSYFGDTRQSNSEQIDDIILHSSSLPNRVTSQHISLM